MDTWKLIHIQFYNDYFVGLAEDGTIWKGEIEENDDGTGTFHWVPFGSEFHAIKS